MNKEILLLMDCVIVITSMFDTYALYKMKTYTDFRGMTSRRLFENSLLNLCKC